MRPKKTILMGLVFALLVSLLPMHGAMSSVSLHPSDALSESMDASDFGQPMNHMSGHDNHDNLSNNGSDCSEDGHCCLAVPVTPHEIRSVHIHPSFISPVVCSGIAAVIAFKPPQV